MFDLSLRTTGFEQVRDQINSLEQTLKVKARKSGIREVGKTLKRDLQTALPVDTGTLKKAAGYKVMSKQAAAQFGWNDDDIVLEVGATRAVMEARSGTPKKRFQTYIMRFLEYGTKAHVIRARRGPDGKIKPLGDGRFTAMEIQHPGIKGRGILQAIRSQRQNDYAKLFIAGAQRELAKHGVR